MTGREKVLLVRSLESQIVTKKAELRVLCASVREITGWGVPTFREGTAAGAVMKLARRTGNHSFGLPDMLEAGIPIKKGKKEAQRLEFLGYLKRTGFDEWGIAKNQPS